jgi:hypothetical protein
MSEQLRATPMEIEPEEARRARLFRVIMLLTIGAGAMSLVVSAGVGLLVPASSAQYVVLGIAAFLGIALFSLWLSRRGRLNWAINVYLLNLSGMVFTVVYFVNGVAGPVAVVLVAIPVMAVLLGGRAMASWATTLIAVVYSAMAALEASGVLLPGTMLGPIAPQAVYVWITLIVLGGVAIMVTRFADLMQRALVMTQQRGLELTEVSQRAERAALAEREAREREERAAQQLRQVAQEYTAFLERVTAGDHSARLVLDESDQGEGAPRELLDLGRYLNDTVETLVAALRDMESIQRRYVRTAWGEYAEAAAHRGFRYHDAAVGPADDAWLPPMTEAVQNRSVTTNPRELALPIALRGEIIGAVGARRGEEAGWSDEDIALAQTITDQLTQTIESLRLLDETQRRATREQALSQMTAHFTRTLDMDTLLQTAVRELGQLPHVTEVSIHTVPPDVLPPVDEEDIDGSRLNNG